MSNKNKNKKLVNNETNVENNEEILRSDMPVSDAITDDCVENNINIEDAEIISNIEDESSNNKNDEIVNIETPVTKTDLENVKVEEKKTFIPPILETIENEIHKLKLGEMVKIKSGCKNACGETLPTFAFKNIYKVTKILTSRVILEAGQYKIAVKRDSIVTDF